GRKARRPAGGRAGGGGGPLPPPLPGADRRPGGSRGRGGLRDRSRARRRCGIEGRALVVVPTYNERENVLPLIREILAQDDGIDVWVADDGSPDGTAEAVREAMAAYPGRVDLLFRREKGGRGAAVSAAFKKGLLDPSGYRAYRREVLAATEFDRIKITGYVVHGEMAYQAWIHGFRLGEVPIHFKNRARDASKLTREEITMALLNFALLRFRYGFRPKPRPKRDGHER